MPLPDFIVPGQGQKAPSPGAGMPINPVEIIQKNNLMLSEREKLKRANVVYGQHAPLRMLLERNVLSQHRRLPGLRSNLVGLCESMGIDDDIEPEDMFYQQDECPTLRTGMADLHSMMEERLGMHDDITEVTNLNLTSDAFKSISHSMAFVCDGISGRLFYRKRPRKVPAKKPNRTKWLEGLGHMKGICVKVKVVAPRKPNSGLRKVARVRLANGRIVLAYIPGIGHNLQAHSVVLVRGGRTPDVIGCNYKIVRGAYDCLPVKNRLTARSKYGVKRPEKVSRGGPKEYEYLTTTRDRKRHFLETGEYLPPGSAVPRTDFARTHRPYR